MLCFWQVVQDHSFTSNAHYSQKQLFAAEGVKESVRAAADGRATASIAAALCMKRTTV